MASVIEVKWSEVKSLGVSDSLRPHGLQPIRLLRPWDFARQECWSGLPFPSPGDLPDPGIEPWSPTLQADALPSEPPGKRKQSKPHPIVIESWLCNAFILSYTIFKVLIQNLKIISLPYFYVIYFYVYSYLIDLYNLKNNGSKNHNGKYFNGDLDLKICNKFTL